MDMSQWNAKTSTLIILGGLGLVMLLIVVLPDVDLPDTAFHAGTAPAMIHARATAGPIMVAAVFGSHRAHTQTLSLRFEPRPLIHSSDPNFRSILLRTIRC
jgi:hypothetical protein